eukprot:346771-Karenia_brevis.AAC.1
MDRLLNLEAKSLQELLDYINGLPLDLPAEVRDYVLARDGASTELHKVARHRDAPAQMPKAPPGRRLTKYTRLEDAVVSPSKRHRGTQEEPSGSRFA